MMKLFVFVMLAIAAASCEQSNITSIANDNRQITFGFNVNSVSSNNVLKDGSGIVFRADSLGPLSVLYYVPTSSDRDGNVVQISEKQVVDTGSVGTSGSILGHSLSPDNSWVVYWGQNIKYKQAPQEFFSVGTRGGTINKLSGVVPNPNSNNPGSIRWKPDSGRISWYATILPAMGGGRVQEIFSNVQSGGSLKKLNPDLGQKIEDPLNKIAVRTHCNGATNDVGVLIGANPGSAGLLDGFHMYTVDWDGSNLVDLSLGATSVTPNQARYPGTGICGRWSPDNNWVVWNSPETVTGQFDLYSWNRQTSTRKQINAALETGNNILQGQWQITPDSQHVVYAGRFSGTTTLSLYSTDIGGAANVLLNGDVRSATNFRITSDSKWVIYEVTNTQMQIELFASKIGVQGSKIKLNAPILTGTSGVVSSSWNIITNPGVGNATYLVLFKQVTQTPITRTDIFVSALPAADAAVGANGASTVQLSVGLTAPGVPGSFATPASSSSPSQQTSGYTVDATKTYVIFRGLMTATGQYQVFRVGIDGSSVQILLTPRTFGNLTQSVANFQVSQEETGYVVARVTDFAGGTNIFKTHTIGATALMEFDISPIPSAGQVLNAVDFTSYEIHPDGHQVIYYMSFPSGTATARGFWSISIKGGDLVRISFVGANIRDQGASQTKTFLPNGDILYIGDIILNTVNDYIRNKAGASAIIPGMIMLLCVFML